MCRSLAPKIHVGLQLKWREISINVELYPPVLTYMTDVSAPDYKAAGCSKRNRPRPPWKVSYLKVSYLTTPFGFGVGVYSASLKVAVLWSNASACTWLVHLILKSPTLWERTEDQSSVSFLWKTDTVALMSSKVLCGLIVTATKEDRLRWSHRGLCPSGLDWRLPFPLSLQPQLNECCTNMFFSRHLEQKNVKKIVLTRSGWHVVRGSWKYDNNNFLLWFQLVVSAQFGVDVLAGVNNISWKGRDYRRRIPCVMCSFMDLLLLTGNISKAHVWVLKLFKGILCSSLAPCCFPTCLCCLSPAPSIISHSQVLPHHHHL